MRVTLIALIVLAGALSPSEGAVKEIETDLFPVKHLKLVDSEGVLVGEYMVAQQRSPTAEIGLIGSTSGETARLSSRLDPDAGVWSQRFDDLSSGWWVEWRFDFGFGNLGEPEDFASPWDWLRANQEREKRLNPASTYTVATSDGPAVQWVEQRGEPEQADEARLEALAHLAAEFAESPPPESARKLLSLASSFAKSRNGHDSCGQLIEALTGALNAAGKGSAAKPGDLQVRAETLDRTQPLFEQLEGLDPILPAPE